MDADVLIIGAGVAGLSASARLAALGRTSIVVEMDPQSGGHAAHLPCQATQACARCGACLLDETRSDLAGRPGVSQRLGVRVASLTVETGGYRAEFRSAGGNPAGTALVAAVILAAGYRPFDPTRKPRLGYGCVPNVVTALDVDRQIRETDRVVRPSDGTAPARVAFIQCVGSRDKSLGRDYCSRVCCGYALRLGRWLRYRYPQCAVSFFYMDIQNAGRNFGGFLEEVRREIELVAGIPGELCSGDAGTVQVPYVDPETGGRITREFDLVVLSVGLGPPDAADFSPQGFARDDDGFFLPRPDAGLFVAGAAGGPMGVAEAKSSALQAAAQAAEYVSRR